MNHDLREAKSEFIVCGFIIPPVLIALTLWVAYVWYADSVRLGEISIPGTIILLLLAGFTAIVAEVSIRRAYTAWRRIKHPQRPRHL